MLWWWAQIKKRQLVTWIIRNSHLGTNNINIIANQQNPFMGIWCLLVLISCWLAIIIIQHEIQTFQNVEINVHIFLNTCDLCYIKNSSNRQIFEGFIKKQNCKHLQMSFQSTMEIRFSDIKTQSSFSNLRQSVKKIFIVGEFCYRGNTLTNWRKMKNKEQQKPQNTSPIHYTQLWIHSVPFPFWGRMKSIYIRACSCTQIWHILWAVSSS